MRSSAFAVTPAKLPIAARAGIQEIQGRLDYRFRGNDEREAVDLFGEHVRQDTMDQSSFSNLEDFSLTKGGPFFKLMVRSGLIKPDFASPARRATVLALFIWLPIFILSLLHGLAFGGPLELPFLWDFTVHVRFLISVPLLIIAEVVLDARTNAVVKHFINSGLVQEKDSSVRIGGPASR